MKNIEELKHFVEKETFILDLYTNNKLSLTLICNELFSYIIFKNKILSENSEYYNIYYLLIKNIFEIEFDLEKDSLNIFYSMLYFFLIFEKEIYHLLDIYTYISIYYEENENINKFNFYDFFISEISNKKKSYKNQDLLSNYLFTETIFSLFQIFINMDKIRISHFKNIVPEFIRLYETLNLNGREIYTFIELIKVNEILYCRSDDEIKKNLFELIINASLYEISVHLNIYLNQQKKEN